MMVDNPDVFWSVIVSMYFGNIVLLILNLPLIPYISKLLMIPRTVLVPMILFFAITGVYLVSFNTFDIYMMVFFCIAAIGLRMLNFPMAPLLLGFVLGGLMEDNLRRALMISDGSLSFLWERPITFGIMVVTIFVLIAPIIQNFLQKRRSEEQVLAGNGQN